MVIHTYNVLNKSLSTAAHTTSHHCKNIICQLSDWLWFQAYMVMLLYSASNLVIANHNAPTHILSVLMVK